MVAVRSTRRIKAPSKPPELRDSLPSNLSPEHVRAAELFGAAYYLATEIGEAHLFAVGTTTHADRLDMLRSKILEKDLAEQKAKWQLGRYTYREAFALMFGVPLELQSQAG